jgi:hypothetical protein
VMFCNTRNLSNLSNSLSNDLTDKESVIPDPISCGRTCLVSRSATSLRESRILPVANRDVGNVAFDSGPGCD